MHAVTAAPLGVIPPNWTFRPSARIPGAATDGSGAARHNDRVLPRSESGKPSAGSGAPGDADELMRVLYREHAGPLLMFVLRLTGGDRQRAEDVVQETLLRAWRNADRLNTSTQPSLRPWLVTVARRIVIDEHRSVQARPQEMYDQDLTRFAEADETDQVVRRMTITSAFKTLSPVHREIILATYFRGRTVPEAAAELGVPLGTAKSRVYYALRALREALEAREVTEA
ncbi:RNA polymerase sigma-70 factor, ECF subfamily [Asanoa ishikariensis]|uniref:RNA polymerase sigma-70 factor, ECF subfamily n=1 Tax=Asanoa ishikariensis TaxID=137265 RepID=A0A1H3UF94_9ACTN|nr:RNA polymerase sigma-70 factor, ECF subfamily [Asanoa ishikariensis]